ncbi:MAG: nickel pincer cofactor biosynthesis protein LarB [Bacillota bacterium]|uniref:PurE domain-containing protein n=2 Tax=Carboxydocella TaxID=178898 RepID=A0A1T4RRI2_9FIRM|nr:MULTISPECIES: nickel pincer cofactor biosynthesis protein LarB [Carboxydocella]AVX21890.1 hypothetical protein CFE_2758 [Carboxydocella thermautotrophica]AVX32293.1 hypothetical protein CTH_2769 [Carboxydocella thermautotrophica]SKA18251.1 hypothetical protein SAMN02745885_02221 [Carboxydocella sporoproducens DSM 16521]GAW28067.1 1-(5-phosphoribosyl)-5-amino-4-imidazole-carboxylate carboxylase [Carboxydocella sp. ULO1]GAW32535.1 1-(5-phosphoribosyl)-5-amino-4-imidazole-carboxylate carboxyla
MDTNKLLNLFEQIRDGSISPEAALDQLRDLPFRDLGFAKLDFHRQLRQGFPEVIFGQNKTAKQLIRIFSHLKEHHGTVIATRVSRPKAEKVLSALPELTYHPQARCLTYGQPQRPRKLGTIGILAAGTADLPVAEEAALCAEMMGNPVQKFYDVGVAGLHRLLHLLPQIRRCNVLICVAGMEGALPSVIGGLVSQPVIAVPTSVGYGSHWQGLAPLLTMLNSCAPGIGVVNIDNGYGAAALANAINRLGGVET